MLARVAVISVVAVGMCVCGGVISAIAFACIFVLTLVALCGAVAEAGGWSGFGLARAAAFTFASARALAFTLLLVIAVALVLLFGFILVASVIVAKVGGGSL